MSIVQPQDGPLREVEIGDEIEAPQMENPSTPSDRDFPPKTQVRSQTFERFLLSEKNLEHLYTPPIRKKKRRRRRKPNLLARIAEIGVDDIVAPERQPRLIVICQFLILAAAWTFSLVVYFKKTVPLPLPSALWSKKNQNLLTLMITLFATAISALSSFFLSLSIRYAVNYHLFRRSMTIFSLGSSVKVLNRSFILNYQHLWWTFVGASTILTTSTQTAGWSTLLTPVGIVVATPLAGVEIDITKDLFITNNDPLDVVVAALPTLSLIGISAAVGITTPTKSLINFRNWTFEVSTAGINPVHLGPSGTGSALEEEINPSGLERTNNRPLPQGFSTSLIVNDHMGFTANVSCHPWTNADDTTFQANYTVISDVLQPNFDTNPPILEPGKLYASQWSRSCGNITRWTDYFYTFSNNTLAGLACPDTSVEAKGPTNYTLLLFIGPETMFCSIAPQITLVQAIYNVTISNTVTAVLPNASADNLMEYAISVLENTFIYAQRISSNSIQDSLYSMIEYQTTPGPQHTDLSPLYEAFIKGHLEYTATLIRSTDFLGLNPSFRNITGTYLPETIGFTGQPSVLAISLLPITCVGLASIATVFYIWIQKRNDRAHSSKTDLRTSSSDNLVLGLDDINQSVEITRSTEDDKLEAEGRIFDIGDPFHLLAVASAGGITGVFGSELDETRLKMSHTVEVRLGKVKAEGAGGGPRGDDESSSRIGLVHG